jgi:hypothetical protein
MQYEAVDVFLGPRNRRIIVNMVLEARSGEQLEFIFRLTGKLTGDEAKDQKAGILSVYWFSKDGIIESPIRGFSKSEQYGSFRYIPVTDETGMIEFVQTLQAPHGAERLILRVMPFANNSIGLLSGMLSRIGQG